VNQEEQRRKRAEQRRETRRLIEVAKVKALAAIMAALPKMVADLDDDAWEALKRNEDRRRRETKLS
jgi:hypothetical protein